jgi:hypothetical protein
MVMPAASDLMLMPSYGQTEEHVMFFGVKLIDFHDKWTRFVSMFIGSKHLTSFLLLPLQ